MAIDNGHIAGHVSLPPDTERSLTLVIETALTELAENVVQNLVDKKFQEIVDKVLQRIVSEKFDTFFEYLTQNFRLSPEGEANIVLIMETALQTLAEQSVNAVVDEHFDMYFKTVMAEALNSKVKLLMLHKLANFDITVSDVQGSIVANPEPPSSGLWSRYANSNDPPKQDEG